MLKHNLSQHSMVGYQMIRLDRYSIIENDLSDREIIAEFLRGDFSRVDPITGRTRGLLKGENTKKYSHQYFKMEMVSYADFEQMSMESISNVLVDGLREDLRPSYSEDYGELLKVYIDSLRRFGEEARFYFLSGDSFQADDPKLQDIALRVFVFCHITIGISHSSDELLFMEWFFD